MLKGPGRCLHTSVTAVEVAELVKSSNHQWDLKREAATSRGDRIEGGAGKRFSDHKLGN